MKGTLLQLLPPSLGLVTRSSPSSPITLTGSRRAEAGTSGSSSSRSASASSVGGDGGPVAPCKEHESNGDDMLSVVFTFLGFFGVTTDDRLLAVRLRELELSGSGSFFLARRATKNPPVSCK